MTPWAIALLLIYCAGMVAGQLLFKCAAMELRSASDGRTLAWAALTNVPLVAALVLYAALTGLWVYILSRTDLSRAYAFNALPLVLTPLMAARLFGENVNGPYYIGLFVIVSGLLIIAWGSAPR